MTALEQDAFGHAEDAVTVGIPEGPTARLYAAEDEAFRCSLQVYLLDGTQEAAQVFATKVVRSSHWKRHCRPCWFGRIPTKAVVVRTAGVGSTSGATTVRNAVCPEIRLGGRADTPYPAHVRNRWVILHELAHVMTRDTRPAHGREFAHAYLGLVRRFLGAEAGKTLLAQYRAHGVAYLPRRQR